MGAAAAQDDALHQDVAEGFCNKKEWFRVGEMWSFFACKTPQLLRPTHFSVHTLLSMFSLPLPVPV